MENKENNILNRLMSDYDRRRNTSPISVSREPSIVNTNELVRKSIERNTFLQSYNKDYWDSYAKYNVFPTHAKSQEELDRERAENQSGIEQFGRFLGQSVGNEIVLGTVRGMFDMIDAAVNAVRASDAAVTGNTDNLRNDYTNPVSKWLTEQQDKLRQKWEIYEKDPNRSFAIDDFGWWMSNATSILSSVALLIPSMGTVKGLSYVGKLSKGLRLAEKGLGVGDKFAAASKYVRNLNPTKWDQRAELLGSSVLSRTMENYQEGRDVYEQVYDSTLQELNNMADVQKNYFLQQNPEFNEMTNEEIAEQLASQKATNTFVSDYALLMFDVMQLKALDNFWKGARRATTVGLRQANKDAISQLAKTTTGETTEETAKITFGKKLKDWATYSIKHPLESPAVAQLSEGVEEGYQGIISAKNIDDAEAQILNTKENTILSYLSDPEVWEQAVWGWIGGISFQSIGSGLGRLSNRIKAETKKRKEDITPEEYNLLLNSEEEVRKKEIQDRAELLRQYDEKMDLINRGVNIYKQTSDGRYIEFTNENEKELAKDKLTTDLITEMTMSAINAGNYDLLREYVTDENFDKHFTEKGIDTSISKRFVSKMDEVANQYEDAIIKIQNSTSTQNRQATELAARQIVRQKQNIIYNDVLLDEEYNLLSSDSEFVNLNEDAKDAQISVSTKVLLKELEEEEAYIKSQYEKASKAKTTGFTSDGRIVQRRDLLSKYAYEERLKEINKKRKFILNYIKQNTTFGAIEEIAAITDLTSEINLKEIYTKYNNWFEENFGKFGISLNELSDNIKNKYNRYIQESIINDYAKSTVPNTKQQYKEIYEEFYNTLEGIVNYRLDKAYNNIVNYLNSQPNLNEAIDNILKEENITNELKESLKLLKIGSKSSNRYTRHLLDLTEQIEKERGETSSRNETVVSGTTEVSNAERKARESVETDSFSTGEEVSSSTKTTTPTEETVTEEIETKTEETSETPPVEEKDDKPAKPKKGFITVERISPDGTKVIEEVPEMEYETYNITPEEVKSTETIAESYEAELGYGTYAKIDIDKIGQQFNGMLKNPTTRERTINAITKGFGSKELNDIIDELVEYTIIETGVSQEEALSAVKSAIKLRLEQINNYNKFPDEKTKQAAIRLINKLSSKSSLSFEGDLLSSIDPISNEEYRRKLEELLNNIYNEKGTLDREIEIDVKDLFKEIIQRCKDNGLDLANAKAIYYQLRKLFENDVINNNGVINNTFGKFRVTNLNLFLEDENNFFQSLIDAYDTVINIDNKYHIRVTNGINIEHGGLVLKNGKEIEKIISRNIGKKAIIRFNGKSESPNSAVISVYDSELDREVEIGYIPFVDVSSDNTEIRLRTDNDIIDTKKVNNEFRFIVKNTPNGVTLNLDDIVYEILNESNENIYNILRDFALYGRYGKSIRKSGETIYQANERLKKELIDFYNSDIIQKFIKIENRYYKENGSKDLSEYDKAIKVANSLINIIFYDKKSTIINDKFGIEISYENFKQKILDNYKTTKTIEDNLKQSVKNEIAITLQSTGNRNLIITSNERGINEIRLDTNKNTIVYVNEKGEIETENGTKGLNNTPNFNRGTMGFLIENYEGNPFVATFISANNVSEVNPLLYEAIEKELKTVLNKYYNAKTKSEIDLAFEELKDTLMNLINTNKDGLFKGLRVFYNADRQSINITPVSNIKNNIINFYKFSNYIKYDKGTKQFKRPDETVVNFDTISDEEYLSYVLKTTIIRNGDTGAYTEYMSDFNNATDRILNTIKKRLTFNNTGFAIRNNNKRTAGSNPYFYKKDGKIIVEIGDYKKEYNNFGELVIDNNAFNTRQGVTEDGNYFEQTGITKSLYFNVDVIEKADDNTNLSRIEQATINKPIKTIDLLIDNGISFADALIFTNEANNLVPLELYYDSKEAYKKDKEKDDRRRAYTKSKTNNIVITPEGLRYLRENPKDLLRLLIHENIHARINSSKFFNGDIGTVRIDDTLETLRQFEEYVNNDNSGTKESLDIKKFLNDFKKEHAELYKVNTRDARKILANEWMAEVFSQSVLANYLNRIEYKEDKIKLIGEKEQHQTLFSKLVDLLLQIFDKINKNSILDQLNRINRLTPVTKTSTNTSGITSKVNKETAVNTAEDLTLFPVEEEVESTPSVTEIEDDSTPTNENTEESIPTSEENENTDDYNIFRTENDLDIDLDTDDLYSAVNPISSEEKFVLSNTAIQTGNFIRADDMSDFIREFRIPDRQIIASELAENRIKYYCR